MIGYATVTGTKRNVAALRDHGWGWLFSAAGWLPSHAWVEAQGIEECCGDSGAYHYHNQNLPFDVLNYERLLTWIRPLRPRFVMLPDILGQGRESLALSMRWCPILAQLGIPAALVVQDGMTVEEVLPLVGPDLAVCIGGTTEWKLDTLGAWCGAAHERGAWVHVLRVNTARRIRLCDQAGANSFDGTSASMYASSLPALDRQRRVQDIEGFLARNRA